MKLFFYYQRLAANVCLGLYKAGSRIFVAIVFLTLGVQAGSAYADSTCSVSTSGVSFGAYDVFSPSANETVGNISVACTGLTGSSSAAYDILISTGGGSFTSRLMSSGSHTLAYNLYTDSNRSIVWGDGSVGTQIVSDSYSLGLSQVTKDYSIYGRIPAQQNAYVGSYSDTLVVTVNFQ